MVYLPVGKTVTINSISISANQISAWWFNPRDATAVRIGLFKNKGAMEFTPPVLGAEKDWVLALDNPDYKYKLKN